MAVSLWRAVVGGPSTGEDASGGIDFWNNPERSGFDLKSIDFMESMQAKILSNKVNNLCQGRKITKIPSHRIKIFAFPERNRSCKLVLHQNDFSAPQNLIYQPQRKHDIAMSALSSTEPCVIDKYNPDEVHSITKQERIGVLLLNLGGPETLNNVQPFLYNLFADPQPSFLL